MRKLCYILMLALFLILTACDSQGGEGTGEQTDEGSSFSFEQHGELLTSSASYYENGFLYYHDDQHLHYMNVETGAADVLCWDPLCLHEEANIYSTCKAITFDDGWLRVIADDGMIWFTAWDHIPRSDGFSDRVYQLRCLNVETNELTVYFEKNDIQFFDFWRYNGNTYISMPQVYTDEEGRTYTRGGALCRLEKNGSLTTMLAVGDDFDDWKLCSVDKNGLYVKNAQTGAYFRTDETFEPREAVSVSMSGDIYDGYVYYLERTDNKQTVEGKTVDVEIMEDFSVLNGRMTEYCLMRCSIEGDSAPEVVYSPVRMPEANTTSTTRVFWIDRENGKIYIVPCELTWKDYILWEETDTFAMQQMQINKPILTNIFSYTNGRLVELDLKTMEARDVLCDTGSDIVDIYAITNGKIAAEFSLYDPVRIRELQKKKELQSSHLEYRYNGVMPLD